MKFSKVFLAMAALSVAGSAFAHGYVSQPPSRGFLCTATMGNQNQDCGAGPQYEPQSLEGADGYPAAGPSDGHLASAGRDTMSLLDEQSDSRWVKNPIKAGAQSFTWTFTASHKTKDWNYYITKADWNPNQPLTRASFEAQPFCHVDGNQEMASAHPTHNCVVPERQGYQVIYAAWDVGDTAATFYNVIDVDFGGNNPPPQGDENNPPPQGDENNPPPQGDENNPPPQGDENNPPPQGGDTPDDGAYPAWNASQIYSQPCQKVTYSGKVWLNGWYTVGNEPSSADPYGVWREQGSATMHTQCK